MLLLSCVRKRGASTGVAPTITYFYDAFTTGSNVILSSHTPNIGTAWVERERTGAVFLRANTTGFCIASGSTASIRSVFTALPAISLGANHRVKATFHYNAIPSDVDNPFFLTARHQTGSPETDSDLYGVGVWIAAGSPSAIFVELFKRIAGTVTSLGTATIDQPANVAFLVELQVQGAAQRVYIDDVLKISAADAAISAAGAAGIAIGNLRTATDDTDTNWRIDDYTVQSL